MTLFFECEKDKDINYPTLSQKLISDFPNHYLMYKEKWFTYSDIKQRNRNSLLWQDETVDGIKTGHTDNAGYCLVSSAKKNDTRLIAVTLNSSSERTRTGISGRTMQKAYRGRLNYYKIGIKI